ncbi:cytochrome P450 4C1-like [Monomorium pharaonis]|uniref:cytochrome P450 4C1-like n=1 Tax=Monomorium pharaonis TaxID=307658 RepID=UPI001747D0FE|nr:cytochrome P450 4C1-like [Monomorium pharaonis]XP_036143888.1 cytochrome P450 4C1-like [Monomorium pharaonis]
MFIIILLLFIPVVYLVCHCYVHNGLNGQIFHKIPGPSGYPIIGNILLLLRSREKFWKALLTLPNQYYPIFKLWVSSFFIISIRHPDDLEIMLSSTKYIDKGIVYDIFHP